MTSRPPKLSYPISKLILIGLLSINAVIYATAGSWVATADAMSWLSLLAMFELETLGCLERRFNRALHAIRYLLTALVVGVFLLYLGDGAWLDVANSIFWFALIVLLELEIRKPQWVVRYRRAYWLATVTVFAGLIAMVAAWLWQSAWMDAYDAALWILAFAMIEVDIFRFLKGQGG